jgi:hypothetical protein
MGPYLDDDSHGVRLLRDIRGAFTERSLDRLPSADLVNALNALEESPWGDWPMTPRKLATMLKPFGIGSVRIRLPDGTTPKGYRLEQFRDAWIRYVDGSPIGDPPQAPQTTWPISGATSSVADVGDFADTHKQEAQPDAFDLLEEAFGGEVEEGPLDG